MWRVFRWLGLTATLIGGFLMGLIVGLVFIIPFILIQRTSETEQNWMLLAAGSVGALFAWLRWRDANAGGAGAGDVHGSARWASEREVRASLGGSEGLIAGRENRRGGQLLRYAGEQHLITIAPTFLSNAGLIQIFNVGDVETASWVSRSMGSGTVAYRTASSGESQSPGPMMFSQTSTNTSTTEHLVKRELMTPDEVMRLDPSLEILLRQGQAPVAALKVRYFSDPEFVNITR